MNKHLSMPISTRESQVLKLIADGLTSKEIANKLYISFDTACTHRKNLISKMEARNTAGLVRRAFEQNLLVIA